MNGQYSWKRTDETEIDLADLLKRLCMRWKQILICALASAVLAGGYGYVKNSVKIQDAQTAAETELTEEEAQKVASALELEKEMRGLESYLDGSVLMHTDPYHKYKAFMLYSIDGAGRKNIQKITECYLNYIVNGGAVSQLQKTRSSWNMDKSYLAEIISAYRKTHESSEQIVTDDEQALFYVEITGKDAKMAEQIADDMEQILAGYYKETKNRAGGHRLKLISTQISVTADSGLQTMQRDKRAQLESARANLKAATDGFSDMQMAVYLKGSSIGNEKEALSKDSKDGQEPAVDDKGTGNAKESAAGGTSGIPLRYMLLGLAGGIFVYCCIYVCCYLICDKVKNETEMKEFYKFPYYGGISVKAKTGKYKGKCPDHAKDALQQPDVQLLNRIRLACRNQGITKLCAVSDFLLDSQEKESLECMAGQLKSAGIHTVIAENAGKNTDDWDMLAETGNVLMICRMGTTTHRMIDDAMRFYTENDISVLGAMAFN